MPEAVGEYRVTSPANDSVTSFILRGMLVLYPSEIDARAPLKLLPKRFQKLPETVPRNINDGVGLQHDRIRLTLMVVTASREVSAALGLGNGDPVGTTKTVVVMIPSCGS